MLFLHNDEVVSYSNQNNRYPRGQNHSLELMFAKFATAKNCEKIYPLKLISNRIKLLENNTEDDKNSSNGSSHWDSNL